jgi:eukaryotic-like serine/threonine-protein kinase
MRFGGKEFRGTERFQIERRLGEGAFGVVYLAYDAKRDSKVALKELRQPDSNILYRFKQEFRSLADLQHPNLVQLYELLSDGHHWFFTMELVDGVNFVEYVAGRQAGSASREETATVGIDVGELVPATATAARAKASPSFDVERLRSALRGLAEGVHALHQGGRLHRDIKPSNVLVTRAGRVVLLDFGMVKELAPEGPTRSLTLVGTPAYMSPEQAAEGEISQASDWYSVGVMLYEVLAGRLPFTGRTLKVLANKQDIEPTPPATQVPGVPDDLNSLCVDLLRCDPAARPAGPEILRRLGFSDSRLIVAGGATRGPFVGRRGHLEFLWDAFRAAKVGRPITVYVHGSSGMGKTTLVRRFIDEIRSRDPDTILLAGRCYEQEAVPYKGLDSLMDSLSVYLKGLARIEQEQIIPRDVLALAKLFPVLRQVPGVAHARRRVLEIPDSLELRHRAFGAVRELFARLADQNAVVVFVDDLHWSDLDSAALIEEILRPPDAPALLFIGSYRSEEADSSSPLSALLATRATGAHGCDVRELEVKELAPEHSRELVFALSAGDEMLMASADMIARESGGNPFFLHELVRYRQYASQLAMQPDRAAARGQAELDELILARVSELHAGARQVLEILSLAGRPLEREVLKQAAGVEDYSTALDVLRREHLMRTRVVAEFEEFEPYHAKIGDAIASRIPSESVRLHHARIGLALEKSGRADPEFLFVHFRDAGDHGRAASYAAAAADQAWNALAFERAARLYRHAIHLGSSDNRLRVRLGDALANAGRGEESAQTYLDAAGSAPPLQRLELQRRAVEQLLRSGRIDHGLAILRAVLEEQHMTLPKTPRTALASLLAHRLYLKLRGLDFRERDARSIPPEKIVRLDTCWSVAIGLGVVDYIRGADYQARHLLLALRTGEPYRVARALALEVAFNANSASRRRPQTEALKQRTKELVDRLKSPHALGLATLTAGLAAYLQGEWRRAVELLKESEAIFLDRCTGVAGELDNARNFLLRSYVWLGELNELSRRLPALLKDANERGDLYAATILGVRNSYIPCLVADDVARAQEVAQRAIQQWPQTGFHTPHYIHLCVSTEIDLYSGEGGVALQRILGDWEPLKRSLILRVRFALVEATHLRARAALAAASLDGDPALLRAAERDANIMEHQKLNWAEPLAALTRAAIASARGDMSLAANLLALAASQLDACNMLLYAAAARRRRGELIGSDEGIALIRAAEHWMAGQRISNPQRMTQMLIPGKWPIR